MSTNKGLWECRRTDWFPLLPAAALPRVVATQTRGLAKPTTLTFGPSQRKCADCRGRPFRYVLLQLKLLRLDYFVKVGF